MSEHSPETPGGGNRITDRVEEETGVHADDVPAEENIDAADARDRVEEDPEEQPNATDPESPADPDAV